MWRPVPSLAYFFVCRSLCQCKHDAKIVSGFRRDCFDFSRLRPVLCWLVTFCRPLPTLPTSSLLVVPASGQTSAACFSSSSSSSSSLGASGINPRQCFCLSVQCERWRTGAQRQETEKQRCRQDGPTKTSGQVRQLLPSLSLVTRRRQGSFAFFVTPKWWRACRTDHRTSE